jgi:acyl-CoA synthetase (NDP forming)
MSDIQDRFLPEPEGIEYIRKYNIPYPEYGVAKTPEEAADIAHNLGFPVVIKIVSPDVPHKSDVGGVKVALESPEAVISGCKQILENVESAKPGAGIAGILVCKQADPGLEVIVGARADPAFGMTLMFGLGGIFTEVFEDVTFRLAPIERIDAQEMIREIKGYPLLRGTRGQDGVDLDMLTDLLIATSRMVTENSDISEMDLNPVNAYKDGVMVLDVRIFKRSRPTQ